MDANFVFPRPQPALARPQKPTTATAVRTKPAQTISRESNALRASVLDAALELGIGSNPLVADWMFNNALKEEDEEEDQISSPSLAYGSSATSEESAFSVLTPSSSTHSSSSPPLGGGGGAGVATKFGQLRSDGIFQILDSTSGGINGRSNDASAFANESGNADKGANTMSFPSEAQPEIPIPSRPTTPRKLKKKIKGDGYESEGGYMSEGGAKKKEKEKKKAAAELKEKEKADLKAKEKEKGEDERKRKKSLLSAVKASKSSKDKDKDADAPKGYETDGGPSLKSKSKSKKSKPKSAKTLSAGGYGAGYETDAGYQSAASVSGVKKSKTRFFKLGGSKDKGGSGAGSAVAEFPPVPALPPDILKDAISLPIAERFATTFGSALGASLSSTSSSKAENPTSAMPTPPLPPSNSGSGVPVPLSPGVAPAAAVSSTRLAAATADRSSQVSTESSNSSSNSSKRRAGQFSPTPSSSAQGHGQGSGHGMNGSGASYATLTSSQSHPRRHHQVQGSASRPPSPTSGATMSSPSPSISISISQSQDGHHGPSLSSNMKPSHSHPPISYPLSRLPSPTSAPYPAPAPLPTNGASSSPISPVSPSSVPLPLTPTAPLQINREKGGLRLRPSLEKLGLPGFRSKGASPVPPDGDVGSSSPLISPTSGGGVRPQIQSQSAGSNSSLSPHAFISAPNTAAVSPVSNANTPSPSPSALGFNELQQQQRQQRPAQLTLAPPSDGTSFPSRSPSPSRPNVLAYYDIPPPSPPPMGPLPTVPVPVSSNSTPFPPASILRQRVIDRTPRPIPPDAVPYQHVATLQNIQRGKESPFPARPVLPPGSVPRRYGAPMTHRQEKDSISKDVKRARFASGEPTSIESGWIDDESQNAYSYAEDEDGEVIGYEVEEEEESQEIRGVLDRFEDYRRRSEDDDTQALERSYSLEALKKLTASENQVRNSTAVDDHVPEPSSTSFASVRLPKPRVPDNVEEEDGYDGMTIGNRSSRWSGSIYSRYSVLDEDESGQGRERLVKRVEEMLSNLEGERENKRALGGGGGVIPPVPKLPPAYANVNTNNVGAGATGAMRTSSAQEVVVTSPAGRSWNRF